VRSIARREALRLVARDRDAADLDETGATAPAELEDDAIRRLDLRRALASVPPADRDLLVGRYWQDLSDGDLARRLGVAEATVRVRLHRVRARLRDGW
jgi:RNA polymerase sigma-70 factor (ECF subfamily)